MRSSSDIAPMKFMMMRFFFFCGMVMLAMSSCKLRPEDQELVKYMVAETTYDTAAVDGEVNVFTTFNTFYLKQDTMGYVSTIAEDTILVDGVNYNGEFVTPVVDQITAKIEEAGFTSVAESANPDFAVKVVVLENFSFYQSVSYPGYYSGYYGYYGGYYGPVVSTYYSNFITLVIEVVDVKHYVENGNKYVVIWSAYIGDLGSTLDLTANTIDAVNRSFKQSPYFKRTM